ncbi:AAA family ATPase [Pseudomonas savastanoi]|uniref:AAA family ATPase n=1 Tax=Pseudomonas savastanoi TaxID=29438 RepID=UPI001E5A8B35|nr:AAA family ATPase [Pseudomonas savastanoi]UFI47468.1 AAA family ATPase [Pseudomonas savastanoi]
MRLDHLHLQNFHCYEDAHFDFQPGFNLVVGVNGSGKTSLLLGVAGCFGNLLGSIGVHQPSIAESDVRFALVKFEDRIRFERSYPLVLTAQGGAFERQEWHVSLERSSLQTNFSALNSLAFSENLISIDVSTHGDLPVFAVYQANRRWLTMSVTAELAAQSKPSRLDAYTSWFDAASNLKNFETWFIGKTLERFQRLSRAGSSSVFNDELTWINSAIQCALPDAKGIEYDMELRALVVDMDDRKIPFNDLSDGQRGMVALFADIARRICLLNPHMGKDVLSKTNGIIVIDELDIHLHPGWQRTIAPALKKAFPSVQFIAASHSPQVIGSLQPGEVILLNNHDGSHPRATYGLDSSSILEEVMGVPQREPEIEALLDELFSTLENNELEKARLQLDALKQKAPDLPEFAGAEALLKRKELIGR